MQITATHYIFSIIVIRKHRRIYRIILISRFLVTGANFLLRDQNARPSRRFAYQPYYESSLWMHDATYLRRLVRVALFIIIVDDLFRRENFLLNWRESILMSLY